MDRLDFMLAALIVAAFAFQAWVTWQVRRSGDYDQRQKSAQTTLIWVLPIIGAAIAFSVLERAEPDPPSDRNVES